MVKKSIQQDGQLRILSELISRMNYASALGKSFGGKRDLYAECGFPKTLSYNDYYIRYHRQGVAKAIINTFPKFTWREQPEIKDTEESVVSEFEEAWKSLVKRKKIFYLLKKADVLSGIGRYGILVLGFDDGKTLEQPCENANELLFLQSYGEGDVSIEKWNEDTQSERYGLPEIYRVSIVSTSTGASFQKRVHWTRVIHVAEDCESSEIYGTPRLECCYNDLMSLEQIIGGGAEMYWKGAFPGYNFKLDPNAELSTQSLSAVKDEVEKLMHGLQRYMRTKGITAEALAQQIADPSSFIDALFRSISAATRIPKRILEGSERGELSSTHDMEMFFLQIEERQKNYAEPFILRPFIDRLISFGVLPAPQDNDYEVVWARLVKEDEIKKAEVALKKTQALATYVNATGAEAIVPVKDYLTRFLDFSEDEANMFLDDTREQETNFSEGINEPA